MLRQGELLPAARAERNSWLVRALQLGSSAGACVAWRDLLVVSAGRMPAGAHAGPCTVAAFRFHGPRDSSATWHRGSWVALGKTGETGQTGQPGVSMMGLQLNYIGDEIMRLKLKPDNRTIFLQVSMSKTSDASRPTYESAIRLPPGWSKPSPGRCGAIGRGSAGRRASRSVPP